MCHNATSTVAATMTALRPMVISLLTVLGVANTQEGLAAIAAFDSAQAALANWKQGTSAQMIIQLIDSFVAAFDAVVATVPVVPPEITALVNIISAGIVTVIGILTANSPAPAPTGGAVTPAAQKAHEKSVAADTNAKVEALVPGFKLSPFAEGRAALGDHTVVPGELKSHWNKAVAAAAKVDPKYAVLKTA